MLTISLSTISPLRVIGFRPEFKHLDLFESLIIFNFFFNFFFSSVCFSKRLNKKVINQVYIDATATVHIITKINLLNQFN